MRAGALIALGLLAGACGRDAGTPVYKRADAPIEERVEDLLERMTTEEKVGQLCRLTGWEMYEKREDGTVAASAAFGERMRKCPPGAFWATLRADPWTRKTIETGLDAGQSAEALNALQRFAAEETRLGIPLLFAEECPHGLMAVGATVFPTGLAMAATWDEAVAERVGEAVALEARTRGAHIGFGPVLDVTREPRWSRVEETLGEDPALAAVLGTALVRGMQGERTEDGRHVWSTLKHFAAYGMPEAGRNGARAACGPRQLLGEYLPPFKRAVEAGAGTVMTSYNSVDGVPCTANGRLIGGLLRGEWGFRGAVFSDLFSIDGIVGARAAADLKEAAAKALRAGVDLDLGGNAYGNHLMAALEEGLVTEEEVDSAVRRVLRLKFRMGLFENPYVSPERAAAAARNAAHRELAREAARKGTVLLKNDGILPLSKDTRSVAVIGPNADTPYNQLGDYTAPQRREDIATVLDGVRAAVSPGTRVSHVKGCAVRDTTRSDIAAAVEAAREADVAIVVVGGSSARDFHTTYAETGAATVGESGTLSDMDCGEGFDRATLRLLGDQEKLLAAVTATGTPTVAVYIQGRPLDMTLAAREASALLTAWYPGEQGGAAIADILFGDCNPSGRLPVSIPRGEGQLPVYYSQETRRDYVDMPGSPLYAFGHGLSYTTFEYSGLSVEAGGGEGVLQTVRFTVTNTGGRDGEEVAQLYIRDEAASVAQPPMLLKAFRRIFLRKGESKTLTFHLRAEDLAIYDADMRLTVEPGDFTVMVGAASDDIRLTGRFRL